MIKVNRRQVRLPDVLAEKDSPAARERDRAIKHFEDEKEKTKDAKKPEKQKKFNFRVYKHKQVKAALHQLFRGKCAYCESRYAGTQPMDVEHFRPKSEAADFDGKCDCGYYWLAATWENLVPSCIDCNRARIHVEKPGGKEELLGKDTLFPLAKGAKRMGREDDIQKERALLLDPCRDDPDLYFKFNEGVVGLKDDDPDVLDKLRASTNMEPEDRIKASIRVYGLNRTELVQDRQVLSLQLERRLVSIRQLTVLLHRHLQMFENKITPEILKFQNILEELIRHEIKDLLSMTDQNRPFTAMTRQIISEFRAEFGPLK